MIARSSERITAHPEVNHMAV